jgi:hypothetical protein
LRIRIEYVENHFSSAFYWLIYPFASAVVGLFIYAALSIAFFWVWGLLEFLEDVIAILTVDATKPE